MYLFIPLGLLLVDRRIHLIEEGIDLAFRLGPVQDSNVIARGLNPVRHRLCAAPDYLGRHALAGMGIVRLPDYMCAEELSSGALEEVLNDWPEPPTACHAIYPATRHLPLRVRSFLDFVVESMSGNLQGENTGRG